MKRVILKSLLLTVFQVLLLHTAQSQYATALTVTDIHDAAASKKIDSGVSALLTELNSAFFEKRPPSLDKISSLSKECRSAILAMWETTPFRCIESEIIERGNNTPSGWQVRNIPMYLDDMSDDESYREIAINFDKQGNIEDLYFALEMHHYQSIMFGDGAAVTDLRRRQAILNFIENFRTAYNRKDINLLSQVYSEDALIITGKVIQQIQLSDNALIASGLSADKVEYQVQTKKDYISKLSNIFKSNNRINIVFDEVEVAHHPKFDDIYGVTLKQGWNTTNYSDVGWLFLMIDFKGDEKMEIHVRTWQPEKMNGKQLPEDEILHLGSFKIQN